MPQTNLNYAFTLTRHASSEGVSAAHFMPMQQEVESVVELRTPTTAINSIIIISFSWVFPIDIMT